MVKPAGAKYDVQTMQKMVEKRLSTIKICPHHGASQMPCRICNPRAKSKPSKEE